MLRSMTELKGYAIGATDGTIGHVKDCYFDDESWVVRYLIVDTGPWLLSRKVLVSPISVGKVDWQEKQLTVSVTKEQVKNSPDIDTDKPVSRQHELQYLGYYGYPGYWGGVGMWGMGEYPGLLTGTGPSGSDAAFRAAGSARDDAQAERDKHNDVHLRSCKEVEGYHIMATDGDIGHVESLLVDEETWAIRYLVVKTSNWWGGHQVLIASSWIRDVSWSTSTVAVDLTREAVKDAPPYDSGARLDRPQEIDIHGHYQRQGYWAGELKRPSASSHR